jgi:hypothetical protein
MEPYEMAKQAGCFGVQDELDRARQEIATLKAEVHEYEHRFQSCPFCGIPGCDCAAGEARREVEAQAKLAKAEAEARLAQVVEALRALREESKAMPIPEAIPEAHKERILTLRAHIADVAALAATQDASAEPEARPGVPTELEQAEAKLAEAQAEVKRLRAEEQYWRHRER